MNELLRENAWIACKAALGYETAVALKNGGNALPELVKMAALKSFVEDECGDEYARNLRAYLIELTTKGSV